MGAISSPRVAAIIKPIPNHSIRASFNKAFRSPSVINNYLDTSIIVPTDLTALGLATPMSIMVGTGRGAQAGVLIRNAEALERMERIDTLVVDKTGTLTEGRPKLVAVTQRGPAERAVLWAFQFLCRQS